MSIIVALIAIVCFGAAVVFAIRGAVWMERMGDKFEAGLALAAFILGILFTIGAAIL